MTGETSILYRSFVGGVPETYTKGSDLRMKGCQCTNRESEVTRETSVVGNTGEVDFHGAVRDTRME